MLDLVLTNKEKLVGNVNVQGSLGSSGNEMVDSKIIRAMVETRENLSSRGISSYFADLNLDNFLKFDCLCKMNF
ncbi:hypothetical protein WISP_142334 [Willisornis vidua]|uniref:Uncharacterized protein n=1 Tax=Willisornis vidua TaxID=1566151 RepID=A0ABQ9CLP5_9PASS|nr:hypothetical protein WISP_142334 [Willisornis vidua]